MPKKKVPQIDGAELRHLAEMRLGESAGTACAPRTEAELQRLLHEFEVHQIELEMQNAELQKTRDELETALEKYTDLYDFSPVGYFTLDNKGTILSVNITGAGLVGVKRSRLIGRRFELFVTVEARPAFTAFLEKVFANSANQECEVALRKEGCDPLCVEVEGISVSSDECRIALIDITRRKLVEETLRLEKEAAEKLRLAKDSAEATSRLKSRFLANMKHELRTPMTVVFGMLDVVLLGNLEAEQREFIEIVRNSANSLLRTLNDVLDMAKAESGNLIIEAKPFSLRECITQAVDIITPEVRRKGIDFAISLAEVASDSVVGDDLRVRQVLLNLISNAVRFTERGKVVVLVTAGMATSDGKREFTFTVTDTGTGIPDDKKDLLFRAFSQCDDSMRRKYGGTGLGLAISKEIVELMGGVISFVSEEGVGSTFSFTIPLKER